MKVFKSVFLYYKSNISEYKKLKLKGVTDNDVINSKEQKEQQLY